MEKLEPVWERMNRNNAIAAYLGGKFSFNPFEGAAWCNLPDGAIGKHSWMGAQCELKFDTDWNWLNAAVSALKKNNIEIVPDINDIEKTFLTVSDICIGYCRKNRIRFDEITKNI